MRGWVEFVALVVSVFKLALLDCLRCWWVSDVYNLAFSKLSKVLSALIRKTPTFFHPCMMKGRNFHLANMAPES
jgi:hypothetical protein